MTEARSPSQQAAYRRAMRRLHEPPAWVMTQRGKQRARNRALGRLRDNHRDEYERLVAEEMTGR